MTESMMPEKKNKEYINFARANFSAVSENEAFARAFVAAFLLRLDPMIDELTEIKTAVSEAVSNAVIHGYSGGDREKEILLFCGYDEKGVVTIEIEDYGVGIDDIDMARKPLFTSSKGEERSGMGFTVMESFMDKVIVESEKGLGTKVVMVKSLDVSYGF